MKNLSVFDRHQLKVARDTMKLDDTVARCRMLGGPNKEESREIIERLTGKKPKD